MKLKVFTYAKATLLLAVLLLEMPAVAQADDQSVVKSAAAELTIVNAEATYSNLTFYLLKSMARR